MLAPVLTAHCDTVHALELKEEVPLLPDLKELRNGANIIGPRDSYYIDGMVSNPPTGGLRWGLNFGGRIGRQRSCQR